MNQRPLWGTITLYAFAAIVFALSVIPFFYVLASSLKTGNAIFEPTLWPK